MANVQARLSEEVVAALRQWFAREAPAGTVSAYLFGSYAEGRAHRESDVDVATLLDWGTYPQRDQRFDLRVRLTSELIGALHENQVDLVVLNDVPPELGRKVVQDGIRVYVGNAELDHAYVRDVQLRAADMDPWLRRMRRIALERILE